MVMRSSRGEVDVKNARRGTAAVELAVCLPMLVLLVLGSIEACSMIFLDHTLTVSSYEAARVAIQQGASNAEVFARSKEILTAHQVAKPSVVIEPTDVAAVPRGKPIRVSTSAPCDANSILPPWFFAGKTLSATVTMVKE